MISINAEKNKKAVKEKTMSWKNMAWDKILEKLEI